MENVLQGLMELVGARATMVLDGTGRVVAHLGHAVYDRGLCGQIGGTVTKAIETIQLQQEDWETITAQFADGRILLRGVAARANGQRHVLAIVADGTLNASFATVALRVAANKIRGELERGTSQPPSAGSQALGSAVAKAPPPPTSSSVAPAADSRPVLANSGLSWSRSPNEGSSATGISNVAVADPASAAHLQRCTKELARHVGPMAKVYVQEALRRVSPDAPFSLQVTRQLIDELSGHIEDPDDRAQFRKALLEKK